MTAEAYALGLKVVLATYSFALGFAFFCRACKRGHQGDTAAFSLNGYISCLCVVSGLLCGLLAYFGL